MMRFITAAVFASFAMGCEPETDDPEPGTLEYEHSYARIYRLDRRIDIVLVEGDAERRECGSLSDRAYTELEDTLSALDPKQDYGYDAETQECETPPGSWVHIEGFEHSPFACAWHCCRPELVRAALIYSLIESHFQGFMPLTIDGEPYIAIEPDQPCP